MVFAVWMWQPTEAAGVSVALAFRMCHSGPTAGWPPDALNASRCVHSRPSLDAPPRGAASLSVPVRGPADHSANVGNSPDCSGSVLPSLVWFCEQQDTPPPPDLVPVTPTTLMRVSQSSSSCERQPCSVHPSLVHESVAGWVWICTGTGRRRGTGHTAHKGPCLHGPPGVGNRCLPVVPPVSLRGRGASVAVEENGRC